MSTPTVITRSTGGICLDPMSSYEKFETKKMEDTYVTSRN
jgi:hypothetical protein